MSGGIEERGPPTGRSLNEENGKATDSKGGGRNSSHGAVSRHKAVVSLAASLGNHTLVGTSVTCQFSACHKALAEEVPCLGQTQQIYGLSVREF